MPKLCWMLIATLCACAPAAAEIFKCAGTNGADRYQNFPCDIDSIGSLPSSAPAAANAPPAPALKAATASEPKAGMTSAEVKAIWGEPIETFDDEQVAGRLQVWRYGDNRSVAFNHKHRVVNVQR